MMNNIHIVMEAFWQDCLKILVVDPETGSYDIVRDVEAPDGTVPRPTQPNIIKLAQMLAEQNVIHHEDLSRFCSLISEHLSARPLLPHSRSAIRYCINGEFKKCVLDIYPSKGDGKDMLVFCVRLAAPHGTAEHDAIQTITSKIHKILRINLADETYETVKMSEGEEEFMPAHSSKISDWFKSFADAGNVHPEDEDIYREFTDMGSIKNCLLGPGGKAGIHCRYRRRVGEDAPYKWVRMELMRGVEFSPEHQLVMLVVTDIHDSYAKDMSRLIKLEHKDTFDELTGLKSVHAFKHDASAAERTENSRGIGLLIADLNGLAYANNTFGRDAGDLMIKSFAGRMTNEFGAHNCYRMTGERLGLMLSNIDHEMFQRLIDGFITDIKREVPPPAAIGTAWGDYSTWGTGLMSVDALEKYAETMMNRDKEDIRLRYHRMRHKI